MTYNGGGRYNVAGERNEKVNINLNSQLIQTYVTHSLETGGKNNEFWSKSNKSQRQDVKKPIMTSIVKKGSINTDLQELETNS